LKDKSSEIITFCVPLISKNEIQAKIGVIMIVTIAAALKSIANTMKEVN